MTAPSTREGEARFISVGYLNGRAVAVVWMLRNGDRRIISMRRARQGEEKRFRALPGSAIEKAQK
jgi:uncharacterized DUF497 family protein